MGFAKGSTHPTGYGPTRPAGRPQEQQNPAKISSAVVPASEPGPMATGLRRRGIEMTGGCRCTGDLPDVSNVVTGPLEASVPAAFLLCMGLFRYFRSRRPLAPCPPCIEQRNGGHASAFRLRSASHGGRSRCSSRGGRFAHLAQLLDCDPLRPKSHVTFTHPDSARPP
jgi:hypothetical protein